MTMLRAPTGETMEVSDPADVEHYVGLGATVVGPGPPSRPEPTGFARLGHAALGALPYLEGGAATLALAPANLAPGVGTAVDLGGGALAGMQGEIHRQMIEALLGRMGVEGFDPAVHPEAIPGGAWKGLAGSGGVSLAQGGVGLLRSAPALAKEAARHVFPGLGALIGLGEAAGSFGAKGAAKAAAEGVAKTASGAAKARAGTLPPRLGPRLSGVEPIGATVEALPPGVAGEIGSAGLMPPRLAEIPPEPAIPPGKHVVREHLRSTPKPRPKPVAGPPGTQAKPKAVEPQPKLRRSQGPPSGEKLADRLAQEVAKGKTPGKVAGYIGPPGTGPKLAKAAGHDVAALPESWRPKPVPEAPELRLVEKGPRHDVQYFSESRGEYVDIEKMNQKHIEQAYKKLAAKKPKAGSVGRKVLDALLNESKHRLQTTGIHVGMGKQ